MLARLERDPAARLTVAEASRFHRLYQCACADLARVSGGSYEEEVRRYLESLAARGYAEMHSRRPASGRWTPARWLRSGFPRAFRRRIRAFLLACAVLAGGSLLGTAAVLLHPDAKTHLMPEWPHLRMDPSERVAREERGDTDRLAGIKARGAVAYFTHNTRVSLLVAASGITWGLITLLLLFQNGVLLGAVAADYVVAGEGVFLAAWLLPHGSVEIPALLLAGQAGLVLGGALIGWGGRLTLRARLRAARADVVTLIVGAVLLLAWAGFIEAYLSQYHDPILPAGLKIGLGLVQLGMLGLYLWRAGREGASDA